MLGQLIAPTACAKAQSASCKAISAFGAPSASRVWPPSQVGKCLPRPNSGVICNKLEAA